MPSPAWCAVLLALLAGCVPARPQGAVHGSVPPRVDPGARYVLYLHGRIVEDAGPARPVDPRYGVYEYPQILGALSDAGFQVISEPRPKGTDWVVYARTAAGQVERLLAAGVPPENVTVVGFSKGGGIAVLTSALLRNERVNFVFMAICADWLFPRNDVDVRGRILSLYEASDTLAGSCAPLFERASSPVRHAELRLETGAGHGAFYRARREWLGPVVRWARGEELPAGGRGP